MSAALQRVTVWNSMFADITSEDKFNNIYSGRWAGYLSIPHSLSDFRGKVWIIDSEDKVEEYVSITDAATGIGWDWEESDHVCIRGLFNTENSVKGKRSVLRIEADMVAPAKPIPEYHTREEMEEMLTKAYLTLREEMRDSITATVSVAQAEITRELEEAIEGVETKMETSRAHVGLWTTPGQYTILSGRDTNMLHSKPNFVAPGDVFAYNANNKSLVIASGKSTRNRKLHVEFCATYNLEASSNGYIHLQAKAVDGSLLVQDIRYIDQAKITGNTYWVRMGLDITIPKEEADHPLLTDGIVLHVVNRMSHQMIVSTNAPISLTLISD